MTGAYFDDGTVQLRLGDCREILPGLPDASVDSVVTDPPYELAFMGRAWDASGIAYDPAVWAECLRVLKPGGHLVAFGGTRTYHRLTCAIEDAGFEIRDSIHWIYGSGFPKGQDIAKGIDKRRDDRPDILRVTAWLAAARATAGWTTKQIDDLFGFNGMAGHWTAMASKAAAVPTPEQWDRLRDALGFDDSEIRPLVAHLNDRRGTLGEAWAQRPVIGEAHRTRRASDVQLAPLSDGAFPLTAPASAHAQRWAGWNTALKPAHEPIVLARKPTGFNTTVANVLEHGTGALNIDGCRVASGERPLRMSNRRSGNAVYGDGLQGSLAAGETVEGRWPTNVIYSHPPLLDTDGQAVGDACADECVEGCPVAELDRQSGVTVSSGSKGPASAATKNGRTHGTYTEPADGTWGNAGGLGDRGGASRFFPVFRYEAKAPASERPRLPDGTTHATVKPLALMRWLIRLVTPPGGLVLDPFAGSGTTGEAAVIEGFRAALVELEEPHAELIRARLSKPIAPTLDFEGIA